ncbi:MAG: homoserine O-succinyltransferase, partial [Cucumibacter sp.]
AGEYARDSQAGLDPALPVNYYPGDDPAHAPLNSWRPHAHLLFQNWINEIYQTTPFDIRKIGLEATPY